MKRAWEVVSLVIAVLMAVVCAVAAFRLLQIVGATKDIWDVTTSVGTVAAVIAAIWIATRDDRRRAKEAMEVAKVTAAGLTWRLTFALIAIKKHLRSFEIMALYDGPGDTFKRTCNELEAIDPGSFEDVKALIPLPRHCAFKLAGAQDRLKGLKRLLEIIATNPDVLDNSEERKRQAGQCVFLLRELRDLLELVCSESEAASHDAITSGWPFRG